MPLCLLPKKIWWSRANGADFEAQWKRRQAYEPTLTEGSERKVIITLPDRTTLDMVIRTQTRKGQIRKLNIEVPTTN